MSFDRDIVTHYSADSTGATSCTTAFSNWRTAALSHLAGAPGDAVNLNIPFGTYNFSTSSPAGADAGLGFHISDGLNTTVTITANGATLMGQMLVFGNFYGLIANYIPEPAANYVYYVDTVAAGSTTVQLQTPAQYTLISANSWIYIGGFDIQGDGQPTSHQFFEYVYVTSVTSGGLVTFSAPLENDYRSDWPQYVSGTYRGGPVALYKLSTGWNQDLEIINAIITNTVSAPNSRARHVKYTNCTVTDNPPNPSEIMTYEVSGGNWSAAESLEVDKLVNHILLDGANIARFDFQSSSIKKMTLQNGTVMADCHGTPQILEVYDGSTITALTAGCWVYGVSREITADSSAFGSIGESSSEDKGRFINGVNNDSDYSMTAGVIRVPATRTGDGQPLPLRWAVPGEYCLWKGSNGQILGSFRVISVTLTGGYIYATTSESGGFPSVSDWGGGLWIKAHPCSRMRFTNCTGAGALYSRANYYDRPYNSYYITTFNQDTIGYSSLGVPGYTGPVWGTLDRVNVTVNDTYVGAQGTLLYAFASIGTYPLNYNQALLSWNPRINLTALGTRTVNRSGTVTNAQTSDASIDFSGHAPSWLTQGFSGGVIGTNPSLEGALSVEVEIFADQGISYAVDASYATHSIEIHGPTYRNY